MSHSDMSHLHVLVLGDQLTRQVGPLANADPATTSVLMIESLELGHSLPHHKQKLVHCFSCMRHFAAELKKDGFTVVYKRAETSFKTGIQGYFREVGNVTLHVMQPNDYGYDTALQKACEAHGGTLNLVPNGLWLSDADTFDDWAIDRKTWRMEHFYRLLRKRYGYLMDGDKPEGDRWNFDKDNRQTPEADHVFPAPLTFDPDALTGEVISFVKEEFPENFGQASPFGWPVTRADALRALDDFCEHRLSNFGPFEDAMLQGEATLYHSLLSPLINVGLLHPREVIERALEAYRDERLGVPLNSIEGFVRQILGWREYMHQLYRFRMPEFREHNGLEHSAKVPACFWSGDTKMNCLHQTVKQLKATGHTHHIQRLMILNNFALIAGVNPQELLEWFTAIYIDALEWVMVPNVIGMGQYADLGEMTSKPYAASANYINKMSNYCKSCHYNPKKKIGEDACPFNSLYWDFLDRHADTFKDNPRVGMMIRNWERQKGKEGVLARAEKVKRLLAEGDL